MNEFRREAWVERARTLLDDTAANLDAATLSRLNRARQAALSAQRRPRRVWLFGSALAGASALALVLALSLGRAPTGSSPATLPVAPGAPTAQTAQNAPGEDFDVLASGDNLEFYEDLEFYAWLDAQGQGTDG